MATALEILIRARDEASAVIQRVSGSGKMLSTSMMGAGARLTSLGSTMTRTVTPAALGLTVAFAQAGIAWDKAQRTLRVGNTQKEFESLMASAKNVAGSVTQPLDAVAAALDEVADRTGQTGKPLEDLTRRFLQLEHLTGEAATSTIPTVTRLFGDWQIATSDQAATMDYLMRASEATGISIEQLSGQMVQFGSPLRQLGFTFDETAAMFAKFEKEGVNVQTALPGLRMALKNLAAPTDDLQKLLTRLGVTAKEPKDQLIQLFDVLKKMPSTAEANTVAFQIFGTRAGPDLAAAIREGRFELDDLINEVKNGDATIQSASESSRTWADTLAMWRNKVNSVLGPVGDLGASIFGLVAIIGPTLTIFGALLSSLGKMIGRFRGASAAADGTAASTARVGTSIAGIAKVGAAAGLVLFSIAAASASQNAAKLAAILGRLKTELAETGRATQAGVELQKAFVDATRSSEGFAGPLDEFLEHAKSVGEMIGWGTTKYTQYADAVEEASHIQDQFQKSLTETLNKLSGASVKVEGPSIDTTSLNSDLNKFIGYINTSNKLVPEQKEAMASLVGQYHRAHGSLKGLNIETLKYQIANGDAAGALRFLRNATARATAQQQRRVNSVIKSASAEREWGTAITKSTQLNKQQQIAVAKGINTFVKQGGALNSVEKAMLSTAIKAGDLTKAEQILNKALERQPGSVRTKIELEGVKEAQKAIASYGIGLRQLDGTTAHTYVVQHDRDNDGGGGGGGGGGPRHRIRSPSAVSGRGTQPRSAVNVRLDRRRFSEELNHDAEYQGF
ncbi:MAG: phage tail tape measure protein [Actinomycetota bacterium]